MLWKFIQISQPSLCMNVNTQNAEQVLFLFHQLSNCSPVAVGETVHDISKCSSVQTNEQAALTAEVACLP